MWYLLHEGVREGEWLIGYLPQAEAGLGEWSKEYLPQVVMGAELCVRVVVSGDDGWRKAKQPSSPAMASSGGHIVLMSFIVRPIRFCVVSTECVHVLAPKFMQSGHAARSTRTLPAVRCR